MDAYRDTPIADMVEMGGITASTPIMYPERPIHVGDQMEDLKYDHLMISVPTHIKGGLVLKSGTTTHLGHCTMQTVEQVPVLPSPEQKADPGLSELADAVQEWLNHLQNQ